MLVSPRRIMVCGMDNSKNRIIADEIPRIDWITILVADQEGGIDRTDTAVAARGAPIEQALIELDPLIIFGSRSRWGASRGTRSRRVPVSAGVHRRIEGAVVR